MSTLRSILDVIERSITSGFASVSKQLASNSAQVDDLRKAVAVCDSKLDQILDLLLLPAADHFRFTVTLDGQTTTGDSPMSFMLSDSQTSALSIQPVDKKGAPASLDGVPVWATSDATIATVDASADATGLTATLSGVRPGTCTITVTGDADLTSGTTPIVGTLDVTVIAGEAVQISISAGAPADQ